MSLTLGTTLGDLKIELACAEAPRNCENFLAHAAAGTYTGTTFHRNVRGFIVQGGDPTGTGKGGKSVWDGFVPDEFHESLRHTVRGVVSMANKGPDTNACQFFITYAPHPTLDRVNTIIGHVIGGDETLDAMERAPVDEKRHPLTPIRIEKVTIHANPFAARTMGD